MPAGLQTFHPNGELKLDLTSRIPKKLGVVRLPWGFSYASGDVFIIPKAAGSGSVSVPSFSQGKPITWAVPYLMGVRFEWPVGSGHVYTADLAHTEEAGPTLTLTSTGLKWDYTNVLHGTKALSFGYSFFGGVDLYYGIV